MKKNIKICGLDCANCAAKIERAAQKIDGVNAASVNFLTQNITLDYNEAAFADIVAKLSEICKKISPDFSVKI